MKDFLDPESSAEIWMCRFCDSEAEMIDESLYPDGWTFTKDFGLICKECSRMRNVSPREDWEDM